MFITEGFKLPDLQCHVEGYTGTGSFKTTPNVKGSVACQLLCQGNSRCHNFLYSNKDKSCKFYGKGAIGKMTRTCSKCVVGPKFCGK